MIQEDHEQQLRDSVAVNGKRFRIHTGVILTFAFICALAGSTLLKNFGISELWIRYAISCFLGYAVFLLLYLLWYQHIRRELQAEVLSPSGGFRKRLYSKHENSNAQKKSNPIIDFFVELFFNLLVDELAIAIGLLVIVVAIVVVLIVSPYIILDLVLAEALLMTAVRGTARFTSGDALWKIALGTVWIFLGLLVAIEMWALLLSLVYPGADSIGGVIEIALRRH